VSLVVFDPNTVLFDRLEIVLGQILVPYCSHASSPDLEPADLPLTAVGSLQAASDHLWEGQISIPVPSPRINGMMGLSGTTGSSLLKVIKVWGVIFSYIPQTLLMDAESAASKSIAQIFLVVENP